MSKIRDVLTIKGDQVHRIAESTSVLEAVRKMDGLGIGCLVVTDASGTPCGMITERDVLRRLATVGDDLAKIGVGEIMTRSVIVCGLDDSIDHVRAIMKQRYVRQLPVVDEGAKLVGIVSLGDVSAHLIGEESLEIKHLHDYIQGRVR